MRTKSDARVDLRLGDLRGRNEVANKLMNVKIPIAVNERIQRVAEALKASKTEVVIALLNEGLDVSEALLRRGRRAQVGEATAPRARKARKGCRSAGCDRPATARGLCTRHYQAARRKTLKK
jgi:hypothetical protein